MKLYLKMYSSKFGRPSRHSARSLTMRQRQAHPVPQMDKVHVERVVEGIGEDESAAN